MGTQIREPQITPQMHLRFREKLHEETQLLKEYLKNPPSLNTPYRSGIELEYFCVDKNFNPLAKAPEILKKYFNDHFVSEVAEYVLEINSNPLHIDRHFLERLQKDVSLLQNKAQLAAELVGASLLSIGSLPTLAQEHYHLKYLSNEYRYQHLNREILKDNEQAITLKLQGEHETLKQTFHDIMPCAAATSIHIHMQVPYEYLTSYYNWATIITPLMVAISANSPFFLGKELWHESRIPLFTQTLNSTSKKGVQRTTLGDQYITHFQELFFQNLDYAPLLPACDERQKRENLYHLKLHNGSVWRWNRPILHCENGQITPRFEHRIPSAGPTLQDTLANTAFFIGLTTYFAHLHPEGHHQHPFAEVKENFTRCCEHSLLSTIKWRGEKVSTAKLIGETLCDYALQGLARLDLDEKKAQHFIEIVRQRAIKRQNGALWQTQFKKRYNATMQELTAVYSRHAQTQKPVHAWEV